MSTLINTRVPTRGQGNAQNGRVRPSSSLPRGEKEKCEQNNLFWKFPPRSRKYFIFFENGIVRKRMISEFSTEQSIWDESLTKSENEEKGLACNDRPSSSGRNFIRLLWTSFAFALATCHTHFPLSFPGRKSLTRETALLDRGNWSTTLIFAMCHAGTYPLKMARTDYILGCVTVMLPLIAEWGYVSPLPRANAETSTRKKITMINKTAM